jgi:hypothetical protein
MISSELWQFLLLSNSAHSGQSRSNGGFTALLISSKSLAGQLCSSYRNAKMRCFVLCGKWLAWAYEYFTSGKKNCDYESSILVVNKLDRLQNRVYLKEHQRYW